MSKTSLHDGTWSSVIERLGGVADLEATAREFRAFERRGKVADAVSLLRLILMYSVGHLSLRATAAAACGTIATLSDKAVEGRLRKSGDWLEHLLQCLLRARAGVRRGRRADWLWSTARWSSRPAAAGSGGCMRAMIRHAAGLPTCG